MRHRPRVVAFLVDSPGDLINLISISSVFSYPKIDGKQMYVSRLLSLQSKGEIRGRDGLTISNCIPYSEYVGPIDILVVLGGESIFSHSPSEDVLSWIRRRATSARRVVSVCTGAFMLAPTGLFDGKRITTHWHHSARLARMYPKLLVDRDKIFIRDGKFYSTAGVTAGLDLALSIVEEDVGNEAAAVIAHTLVLYLRRPGEEKQYSTLLAQQADMTATPFRNLPAWAKSRLTERLDVSTLAQAVSMTPRTFARQFETNFRTTPARWVQSLRIEAACSYLATGDLPLKVVARLVGFRSEQSLRRAFIQQLEMTPKEYRERFGSARFYDSFSNLASGAEKGERSKYSQ
jgi:transcriptional regulator GlxA family with amidase domain